MTRETTTETERLSWSADRFADDDADGIADDEVEIYDGDLYGREDEEDWPQENN